MGYNFPTAEMVAKYGAVYALGWNKVDGVEAWCQEYVVNALGPWLYCLFAGVHPVEEQAGRFEYTLWALNPYGRLAKVKATGRTRSVWMAKARCTMAAKWWAWTKGLRYKVTKHPPGRNYDIGLGWLDGQ